MKRVLAQVDINVYEKRIRLLIGTIFGFIAPMLGTHFISYSIFFLIWYMYLSKILK